MVDLTKMNYESSHISQGSMTKRLVVTDKGKYIFKANKDFSFKFESPTSFGEVFYSRVCEILGCDCVSVDFADMFVNGFLSHGALIGYYLTNEGMEAVSFGDIVRKINKCGYYPVSDSMNVDNIVSIAKMFAKSVGLKFDDSNAYTNLTKLAILDYFFAQTDRHSDNIEFLIEGNKMTLAPIFDNGFCFNLWRKKRDNKLYACEENVKYLVTGNPQFLKIHKPKYEDIEDDNELARQISNEVKSNPEIKKFVGRVYSLDMDEILSDVYNESQKDFGEDYVDNCAVVFKYRKELLSKFIKNYDEVNVATQSVSIQEEGLQKL